jgi:hypothetical protein
MEHPMTVGPQMRNAILAALPGTEIERLQRHLNHVTLVLGQVLHEADRPITDGFFMNAGVASLTASANGTEQQVEVGLMGREGLVGHLRSQVPNLMQPIEHSFRSGCSNSTLMPFLNARSRSENVTVRS